MSNWFALVALIGNVGLVFRRPRLGVLGFVILAMLLPHASVAGTPVAYEIIALPFVLMVALVKRPRLAHPRLHLFLLLCLALITLSTLVGTTTHGTEFDAIRFQGIARFLVLVALCREMLDRRGIEQVLLVVIGINAVVGFAQLLIPGTARIFFELYGRPGQVVLERYALAGVIPRASGTFSSPVILGSVALLALAVGWARLLAHRTRWRPRWLVLLAGLAGILSLTKTFLLGAPLVVLGGIVLSPLVTGSRPLRLRPRSLAVALSVLVLGVALLIGVGSDLVRRGYNVAYYVSYLVDPRAALATRYGPGGHLENTMAVIGDNPLIGVGMTNIQGEFLGDSTYVLLLHMTGLLGLGLALVALFLIVRCIVRAKRYLDLLVVGALLIAGAGLPVVLSLPGALGIVYTLSPASMSTGVKSPREGARNPTRRRRFSYA